MATDAGAALLHSHIERPLWFNSFRDAHFFLSSIHLLLAEYQRLDTVTANIDGLPSLAMEHFNAYLEYEGGWRDSEDAGVTLYRALSRQIYGNPEEWRSIRDATIDLAIRAYTNTDNPYHKRYLEHAQGFRSRMQGKELFPHLYCPDLAPDRNLFSVVAEAMLVRIRFYSTPYHNRDAPPTLFMSKGYEDAPLVDIVQQSAQWQMNARFGSLISDNSGRALTEFLLRERATLRLERFSLAHHIEPSGKKTIFCFNQARPKSRLADLAVGLSLKRLDTWVATVDRPELVHQALELLRDALSKAPNQKLSIRVTRACKSGHMKPHFGMDMEAIAVPLHKVAGKTEDEIVELFEKGEIERVISIMTIGVADKLFFNINIFKMLENADQHTEPALRRLYLETIFNPKVSKVWFNYQQDVKFAESSIAQMYRGTPREPFVLHKYSYNGTTSSERTVQPRFHFDSPYFSGTRPKELYVPSVPVDEQDCEFHAAEMNDLGMSCPCSLGNIDLNAWLAFLCRQHGLDMPKRGFKNPRVRFNLQKLINCTLKHDRRFELFKWAKDRAEPSPENAYRSKLDFYQSLGQPEMRQDDEAVAYVLCDVMAINLIYEQILVSDDKKFIASVLHSYFHDNDGSSIIPRRQTQRTSSLGSTGGVPLYLDNPKVFLRQEFSTLPHVKFVEEFEDEADLWKTDALSRKEHDERALAVKSLLGGHASFQAHHGNIYHSPDLATAERQENIQQKVRKRLTDPTRHWMPSSCAVADQAPYPQAIVRAGQTYRKSLIEDLTSRKIGVWQLPPGLGGPPGNKSLPEWLNRPTGDDIIYALAQRYTSLNAPRQLSSVLQPIQLAHQFTQTLRLDHASLPVKVFKAKAFARNVIAHEIQRNCQQGLPSPPDNEDIFDPEGREYRRRMLGTPFWNKTALAKLEMNPDGSWKSIATMTLQGLNEIMTDDMVEQQLTYEERLSLWYEQGGDA